MPDSTLTLVKTDPARVAVVAPQRLGVAVAARAVGRTRRAPVRQHHVEVAVEVVVAEGRRDRVAGAHRLEARGVGDVGERPVAVVRVQHAGIALHAADEQVEVAVAVDVGEGRPAVQVAAAAGRGMVDARRRGDVREVVVAVVAVQQVRPDVAAHDVEVDVAVAVVVAGRDAAAEHLRLRVGRVDDAVHERDARARRDVRELRIRRIGRRWPARIRRVIAPAAAAAQRRARPQGERRGAPGGSDARASPYL